MKHRLQNKIAGSKFTLPLTSIIVSAAWLVAWQASASDLLLPFVLLGISAYMMVFLNNHHVLMRTYSRMASCSLLVLSTLVICFQQEWQNGITTISTLACYLFLFEAYQNREGMGLIFGGYAAIGTLSMIHPQVVFYVPLLWVLTQSRLMALSLRNFFASLFGLIMPYWLLLGWVAFQGDWEVIEIQTKRLATFIQSFSLEWWTPESLIPVSFIALLYLTGSLHYMRASHYDNIKTRMIYKFFIIMGGFTLLFMLLQPQHTPWLSMMLIVNTAPLIAHFFAYTYTRFTNIMFVVIVALAAAITAYSIWNIS
ncbi:MAG: hypothetical protein IJ196_04385 [Prevotella sp.]|nr:hypothetical protein [Prevotella sp.]